MRWRRKNQGDARETEEEQKKEGRKEGRNEGRKEGRKGGRELGIKGKEGREGKGRESPPQKKNIFLEKQK